MTITRKIEGLLFESPLWKLLAVVFALWLVKTGIWYYPNPYALWAMAQNPYASPFTNPDEQYLMWSWLGPWLTWRLGATTLVKQFLLYFAFSAAFTWLFVRAALVSLPRDLARVAIALFAILPVSTTCYYWVGPDSLTLLLMMAALSFPGAWLVPLVTGILLGMQHFEQGFFGVAALGGAVFLSRRLGEAPPIGLKFCLLLLAGTIGGKLALVGLFRHYGIHVDTDRMAWMRQHLGVLLSAFFFHAQGVVWSVLGLGWLVAARFADLGRKSLPFFAALGGVCLLALISGDQTRVVAITAFPLVAAYWLLNADFLVRLGRREVALLFGLWVIMPMHWTWMGVPKWSMFPYDVAYLLHETSGWFALPDDVILWPFR